MFAITVALFHVTHNYTLVTASQDAERLVRALVRSVLSFYVNNIAPENWQF
jgi:hypothetical protein